MTMTVFLHNKYSKWYFNIISSAQARIEDLIYFEKHHILPKSLGGKNGRFGYKMTPEEIAQRTASAKRNRLLKAQGELKFLA